MFLIKRYKSTMNNNMQAYFDNLESLKSLITSNPNNLIYIGAFAFFCLINFKKSRQSLLYRVYIAAYTAVFALIGARLAYIIFYDPQYYLNNPKEILMITDGNLSLHGALIGGALGLFYLDKKNLSLNADKAVLVALFMLPIGQLTSFFDSDFFKNIMQTQSGFSLFGANAHYRQNLDLYGAFCNGPVMGVALFALRKLISPTISTRSSVVWNPRSGDWFYQLVEGFSLLVIMANIYLIMGPFKYTHNMHHVHTFFVLF